MKIPALCSYLLLCSVAGSASTALAEERSLKEWADGRVRTGLFRPLVEQDKARSPFSRVAQPVERRLKILETELSKDPRGRGFIRFAIDARYGQDWQRQHTGCVYRGSGRIFVHIGGKDYRPAEYLLGKKVDSAPGVCQEGQPRS